MSLTPAVQEVLEGVLGPFADPGGGMAASERVTGVLPRLRELMDCYDVPVDTAPVPALSELCRKTEAVTNWRLASRYAQLADLAPGLISGLTATALSGSGHDQEQAFGLLALAYRAADALADKHGYHDLSARATELVRWAASRSGNPELEMMTAYVRAELFFAGSHARMGVQILDSAAASIPPGGGSLRLAMYGALHMRAAVLASRAGMPEEAADRLAEAHAIARHVPDGVYLGTAFGPSSIRVHELATAVEGGNIGHALRLTSCWRPPQALPAERRSHFHIEAARAHQWAGQRDQAVAALREARAVAPQHARYSPAVAETVTALIHASRKPPSALVQLANWIGLPGR